ncbi:MAG: ankyrin repeat domain-containing protein, partial [Pseudomonadota bacterium]
DPNILFGEGSVVHWAAKNSDSRFLRAALQAGADPNLTAGRLNETPIFRCVDLIQSNLECVDLLLEAGANIDVQNRGEQFGEASGGNTPLLAAATIGRFDHVFALLERGADPSIKNVNNLDLVGRLHSMRADIQPKSEAAAWLEKVFDLVSQPKEGR